MEELLGVRYDVESGDFIRGGEASSKIKKMLQQIGIRQDIIKKICVACYEAEMNIVIHSVGGYIEAKIYSDKIEITALDKGPGIANIELAMQEGYSTASDVAREMGFGGGMGLPNIKRSSDEFYIKSELGKFTEIKIVVYFN
ncbi:Serine/threonine-protein kinase RsbT [Caloramator mitchellensis]|uniref:Serine/threonine-protein kinase RsbT n=1 Tax=Caloramator mitchellensis TaxID=908809 RepID=A0A0R3K0N2_CALMK|nr:anti-sigma regulatory factor [Caloramator mitchellensis]KRQ88093.1 Serine/threonine-protein kinase RsbT [Caloramator mitchellensis]